MDILLKLIILKLFGIGEEPVMNVVYVAWKGAVSTINF